MKFGPDVQCYLCGELGADSKEHYIPRVLYREGKIPSGSAFVLPAHKLCNGSTSSAEERTAHTWALASLDPVSPNDERWARAVRALKRPQAEGLRNNFLDHTTVLPSGGAEFRVPGHALHYTVAKMVKGIVYAETLALGGPIVIGPTMNWLLRATLLSRMVEDVGEPREFHDVVLCKWRPLGDDAREEVAFYIAIHGRHFLAGITYPDRLATKVERHDEAVKLSWPMPKA